MKSFIRYTYVAIFTIVLAAHSGNALACACGCGIFGVGTSSLIPSSEGGLIFTQYDYMNQSKNWQGNSSSPAANNDDRQIKSQTITAGMQYMFNREWGAALRVPYVNRLTKMSMSSADHGDMSDSGGEMFHSNRVNSVGDVRINGIYSGFFNDMSTGITFGLKLPTGKSNAKAFDSRDMQIGTGSTDAIIGAYHLERIDDEGRLNWFAQANLQHVIIAHNGYRPGQEISGATGIAYNAGSFFGFRKISPILQVTGSRKSHDSGWAADSQNSGYVHGYFAPAVEVSFGKFRTYFDVEVPFYQKTNGNQLVASRIYKFILGYNF